MSDRVPPLARTDSANSYLTLFLIILGMFLLVIGNNAWMEGRQAFGAKATDTVNGIGMAILIAAITQYYTDFRVRGRFYKDIADHIMANETLRDSGIQKFYPDSRDCSPKHLVRTANNLDVGVVYSDRFLKDNFDSIVSRKGRIKIRLFMCNDDNPDCLNIISKNIGIETDVLHVEFSKINGIVKKFRESGVDIDVYKQDTIPHYSFYTFDRANFFLTLSTFASRRAEVPLFQVGPESPLADLINRDLSHILALCGDKDEQDA